MLRISIDEGRESVVPRLEGKLIGSWIQEVEQCWRPAFATLGARSVHVDPSAVSFVDTAGEASLARMQQAGFRLAGNEIDVDGGWEVSVDIGISGAN